MKKISLTILCFIFCISLAFAQLQQNVLLTVNGKETTAEEFLSLFKKNNVNKDFNEVDLREYLELYLNFRLKVEEALYLKLDTAQAFQDELKGYRTQLAMPYLTKNEILDKLIEQTFNRMQYDLRASHILIKLSPYASPKDTLIAYRKAIEARNKALKSNSFEEIVLQYTEDPSAKDQMAANNSLIPGNKGDLGYFSALDLVSEFEDIAYSMKIGDISMPVRTEFGYHVIKLTERRPALGRVRTSHILVSVPANSSEEQKTGLKKRANDLKLRIQNGESFEEIAKLYSDDKGSGSKGGVLPWFGSYRMIASFLQPIYDMKVGDVAGPVETQFGFHLIKLNERKVNTNIDEVRADLRSRLLKDVRYQNAINQFALSLKNEYKFKEFKASLNQIVAAITDSIFSGTWTAPENLNAVLFTIDNQNYYQQDFIEFLQDFQPIQKSDDIRVFVNKIYEDFVKKSLLEYENQNLEKKHPDFAALMQEYHDGILLFELKDKMVWNKAIKDSIGLNEFYSKIKHEYLYPPRVEAVVYELSDLSNANRIHKTINRSLRKNEDFVAKVEEINKKRNLNLVKEQGIFVKEEHQLLKNKNSIGVHEPVKLDEKYYVAVVQNLLAPSPRPLAEIRGIVINEYQNYLEQKWIEELRSKYKWSINEEVFKKLLK